MFHIPRWPPRRQTRNRQAGLLVCGNHHWKLIPQARKGRIGAGPIRPFSCTAPLNPLRSGGTKVREPLKKCLTEAWFPADPLKIVGSGKFSAPNRPKLRDQTTEPIRPFRSPPLNIRPHSPVCTPSPTLAEAPRVRPYPRFRPRNLKPDIRTSQRIRAGPGYAIQTRRGQSTFFPPISRDPRAPVT